MSDQSSTIIYTLTVEAPLLATASFLPIIRTFAQPAGVNVETRDISVAGRILATFPEYLTEEQRVDRAAQGRDQGTAGQGLRHPRLPREPGQRRREGHQGPLRQVHRLGRQPGPALRQLRPPRTQG